MSGPDSEELLQRFWRELADVRTGMLALAGETHAQPMTAHFEGGRGPIWFYARKDAELVRGAGEARLAVFHYVSGGHDLFACVHGEISAVQDRGVVSRFWSEEVARWYPGGQDDPDLILLRFEPSKAHIWLPGKGAQPSVYGIEPGGPQDIRAEVRL